MHIIRFFFSKQGEAAYISHLDLQRVMSRALRRSGIPVWYSQGFNPHIYISFSLPLPLAQQSIVETMDCKTEAEDTDFSVFIGPLNAALPRGIEVQRIALPVYKAGDIAQARYRLCWGEDAKNALAQAAEGYNRLDTAMVIRKTKRSEQPLDLKTCVPQLLLDKETPCMEIQLPAGSDNNLNPLLLVGFLTGLQEGLPAPESILRTGVLTKEGKDFC